jgi:hypothetical protein
MTPQKELASTFSESLSLAADYCVPPCCDTVSAFTWKSNLAIFLFSFYTQQRHQGRLYQTGNKTFLIVLVKPFSCHLVGLQLGIIFVIFHIFSCILLKQQASE